MLLERTHYLACADGVVKMQRERRTNLESLEGFFLVQLFTSCLILHKRIQYGTLCCYSFSVYNQNSTARGEGGLTK